jgi:hypothetical protein
MVESDARRPGRGLKVFKQPHETEIHVEILMAVKQGESGVVGDKIDINTTEAFHENSVLEEARCFFSIDLCDLKIVPMQVERMHVVAFVDERESITATLVNLDRFTPIVRLAIDRPYVEPASAAVDFLNLHRNHLVWRKCWS